MGALLMEEALGFPSVSFLNLPSAVSQHRDGPVIIRHLNINEGHVIFGGAEPQPSLCHSEHPVFRGILLQGDRLVWKTTGARARE
jgi:hypothetical protein